MTPDKRVEEWEAVRWRVVSNVQTGRMSLADAETELDKALTQYHQDLMSERDKQWREHLKVIIGTDIYGLHEKYFTPEYWEKAKAQTIIKSK